MKQRGLRIEMKRKVRKKNSKLKLKRCIFMIKDLYYPQIKCSNAFTSRFISIVFVPANKNKHFYFTIIIRYFSYKFLRFIIIFSVKINLE